MGEIKVSGGSRCVLFGAGGGEMGTGASARVNDADLEVMNV